MYRTLKTFGVTLAFVAGLAASQIYADESHHSSGSTMGSGMMGSGMMGGDMMGMMKMMQPMSQTMESCNKMMQSDGSGRPNEQWRQDAPKPPEQKG